MIPLSPLAEHPCDLIEVLAPIIECGSTWDLTSLAERPLRVVRTASYSDLDGACYL